MIEQKNNNLEKALEMLEIGTDLRKILAMFPEDKKDIYEMASLINSLQQEKQKLHVPKEILEKIFKKNQSLGEEKGRFSAFIKINQLINSLKFMNKKLTLAVPTLGVIIFLIAGIILFNFNKNTPEVTTDLKTKVGNENKIANKSKTLTEEKIVTTSSVIGDKETDQSINTIINDALAENDIESELNDIELAMSDEEELNQINNLFNENEL